MIRKIICFLGKIFFIFKERKIRCKPKNILVIRSGAIGDVLMITPFLKAIRKKFPRAKINYLVGEWSKSILEDNKNINKIIPFDDNIVYKKKLFKIIRLIKKIRKEKYDLCFVMDKSYHWGIFAILCGIKNRIGFDRAGEGFANNINISFDGSKYELDYNLELAKKVGANTEDQKMEINTNKKDLIFADNLIKKNNIKGKIIGIAPGGAKNPGQNMFIKRWPLEKYIQLIEKINKNNNIILFGGPGDKEIGEKIESKIESKNLYSVIGKTSLKQAAALIKKCNLFITHDSGLMHLAAATGIKLIALFGPTPSKRFAPKNAVLIESKLKGCPCYDIYGNYNQKIGTECMDYIKVEDVIKKL